ncbi:hypothetical protein ACFL0J_00770 [Candidatus Neomarinimicrobiota bacterium]
MELIITIAIVIAAVFLVVTGALLLFSPELLIRFNDYLLNIAKKEIKFSIKNILPVDVFVYTKRFIFGLLLILLGLYLIYTISLLF